MMQSTCVVELIV